MAIATIADLKRLLDSAPPRGKARIGIGSDEKDQITEANAQSYMDAQEAFILAYLGFTPTVDAFTREIHGKLTAWHIWIHIIDRSHGEGKIPEYVQKWYDWAMEQLENAKNGTVVIAPETEKMPIEAYSSEFRQVIDDPVTLQHDEYVRLKYWPVVPKTEVVCSKKDGEGIKYVRGTDYIIKWRQREIKALSSGTIADLQKVYVSYMHIESKQLYKSPERVEHGDRNVVPGWEGIFGGSR